VVGGIEGERGDSLFEGRERRACLLDVVPIPLVLPMLVTIEADKFGEEGVWAKKLQHHPVDVVGAWLNIESRSEPFPRGFLQFNRC